MDSDEMDAASSGSGMEAWLQQVLELTKLAQECKYSPAAWTLEVNKILTSATVGVPSVELGHLLASHLFWSNNVPIIWKFLEQALATGLLSPLHILALLTSRVLPCHQSQPEAYRLYLELLKRYAFSAVLQFSAVNQENGRIVKAVDEALKLSHNFTTTVSELSQTVVLFVFTVVLNLLNATVEDWGLHVTWSEDHRTVNVSSGMQNMDIDNEEEFDDRKHLHRVNLRRTNISIAMEVVGQIMKHKRTSSLLHLVRQNMPEQWSRLIKYVQVFHNCLKSSPNNKAATELFNNFSVCVQHCINQEFQPNKHQAIRALMDAGSDTPLSEHNYGAGRPALWLPFDLFMEDTMEGTQFPTTSAIEMLSESMKALQAVNGASWQETFLAAWTAALRLVQRERDPIEGPVPHLDARLCMLLAITPLAIGRIIEEEESSLQLLGDNSAGTVGISEQDIENKRSGTRRVSLLSSLKILGQFEGLLVPPQSVTSAANQAAAKAALFISRLNTGNVIYDGLGSTDNTNRAGGSMWHLIVEACIARRLIDSSAYFWPGYVSDLVSSLSHSTPGQASPWSIFMEGSSSLLSLKHALMTTPASNLAELEKMYQIALSGPEEERSAAASILCGASLIRGWNLQEHVVRLVLKLLSPPAPPDSVDSGYLISYAPLLHAVLLGITAIDIAHILSLFGMLPEVAVALLPVCEVFGSISPSVSQPSYKGEDIPVYMVFSCAFLLLLRLWKFYRPPHEHCILARGAPVGAELTLEYLLLLHNNRLKASLDIHDKANKKNEDYMVERSNTIGNSFPQTSNSTFGTSAAHLQPVFIDSFPKVRTWYNQHKACIASTLSGLVHGNPMRQIADRLLHMMYRKMSKGGTVPSNSGASTNSSLSTSSGSLGDDASFRPLLPAWDILEAVPFVVDAVLTACAHGRLSPRDLTTGLKDLVDFLPASLATIVSYFTAEVTRGVWKPASMNGTDWPSPAALLHNVEAEIKEVLAATGVHVPSLMVGGNAPATLPLPLAALVSLTITFKLDKSSEFLHGVAGPALESTAAGSPWPSTPIVAALWAQKVRRWHDYIVFFSSRTVFKQDKHAVVQLLRSCFAAAMGSNSSMSKLTVNGGVGALLGHGFRSHLAPGGMAAVAPGILYLRTFRAVYDIMFITQQVLALVVGAVRELAPFATGLDQTSHVSKPSNRLKSHQISLANVMAKAKQASALGASLLCITGGPSLVQMLYQETLPTWFLAKYDEMSRSRQSCSILEGYVVAYFSILCGAFAWGTSATPIFKKRSRIVSYHMEFIASVLQGKITVGCEPGTWKAYVLGLISMMITCVPIWVSEIRLDTLRRVAKGLTKWHESELAVSLLSRGGVRAMGAAAELAITY